MEIVDDLQGGQDISDGVTPLPYVVGNPVKVGARNTGGGGTLSNISWNIPPVTTIHTYNYGSTPTVATTVGPTDLESTDPSFYWITGGTPTYNLKVTATIAGTSYTATAPFTIPSPTAVSFGTATSSVYVGQSLFARGLLSLAFGALNPPGTTPGIQWDATLTPPATSLSAPLDGSGTILVTQLIDQCQALGPPNSPVYKGTGGKYEVDKNVTEVSIPVPAKSPLTVMNIYQDSPYTTLSSPAPAGITFSRHDQFETYLQYQSNVPNSIPVTLWLTSWTWNGTTKYVGAPHWWSAPPEPASAKAPGAAAASLPIWQGILNPAVIPTTGPCT